VVKVGTGHCTFCEDNLCVWLVEKKDMLTYDHDGHGHLPTKDWPLNNVCHRKICHQMTLFINEGPLGKGVCKELPKCAISGCRKSLPSPTFTGFNEN
jgi:hypothetical protein